MSNARDAADFIAVILFFIVGGLHAYARTRKHRSRFARVLLRVVWVIEGVAALALVILLLVLIGLAAGVH